MEAFAFVHMHIRAYNDLHLWYREVVSDDDSTMRSFLRHQYKDLIAAGLMHEKDWSLKNGYKKADNGKIPLILQVTERFLADPNHKIKTTMKLIFSLGK